MRTAENAPQMAPGTNPVHVSEAAWGRRPRWTRSPTPSRRTRRAAGSAHLAPRDEAFLSLVREVGRWGKTTSQGVFEMGFGDSQIKETKSGVESRVPDLSESADVLRSKVGQVLPDSHTFGPNTKPRGQG